jgi:hypothetical protein
MRDSSTANSNRNTRNIFAQPCSAQLKYTTLTKAVLSKLQALFPLMLVSDPCTDDNRLYEWGEQQIYGKIWFLITDGMAMHLYFNTVSLRCGADVGKVFFKPVFGIRKVFQFKFYFVIKDLSCSKRLMY